MATALGGLAPAEVDKNGREINHHVRECVPFLLHGISILKNRGVKVFQAKNYLKDSLKKVEEKRMASEVTHGPEALTNALKKDEANKGKKDERKRKYTDDLTPEEMEANKKKRGY